MSNPETQFPSKLEEMHSFHLYSARMLIYLCCWTMETLTIAAVGARGKADVLIAFSVEWRR